MPFAFHRSKLAKRVRPQQRAVFTESERIRKAMVQAVRDEVRAMQGGVKLQEVAQLVQVADPAEVLELLNAQGVKGIGTSLEPHMVDGAAGGARIAAKELGQVVVLDMRRPHFRAWLKGHVAELVKQTSGTSMDALKATLKDGINRGRHPMKLARDLRSSIGLTEPHAKAVAKRRAQLLADGMSNEKTESIVERYRTKLINYRANNIARTESITAVSRGRKELWDQLSADDAWPGKKPPLMSWSTSLDEMVCEICAPLNGQRRPLNGRWDVGDAPPAHASCRCSVVLVEQG